MKIYTGSEYKKGVGTLRSIDITPSLNLNLYDDYSFESVRLSWLGFTIGVYKG